MVFQCRVVSLLYDIMEKPATRQRRNFHFCSLCPSSFPTKTNLARHIRGHIKEKIYGCDQCEHRTHDSSALAIHVKAIHEKLTPFRCSFPACNYSAAQRKDLPKHLRTHQTDPLLRRPFPCSFAGCDYRAARKSHLESHAQNRHNENRARDFVCAMCSAAFYDKLSLRAHIKVIHVKVGILVCSQCEYKSMYPQSFRKHLSLVHSNIGGKEAEENPKRRQPTKSSSQQMKETILHASNVVTTDKNSSYVLRNRERRQRE